MMKMMVRMMVRSRRMVIKMTNDKNDGEEEEKDNGDEYNDEDDGEEEEDGDGGDIRDTEEEEDGAEDD